MPRARNVKPAFFSNDLLAELDFSVRLLFIGLWTLADREGRLEDRPTKIKMQLFPADAVDVDQSLDQLAERGFIARYEANGVRYVQVVNFRKHQTPHANEQASVIPPPDLPPRDEALPSKDASASPLILEPRTRTLDPDTGLLERENGADAPRPPAKRTSIPDDFEPSADDRAWAAKRGLDGADVDRETEKFVAHYQANGELRKDWRQAWRSWILKVPNFGPPPRASPANGRGRRVQDYQRAHNRFMEIVNEGDQ